MGGLAISDDTLKQLYAGLEGWIVGLRLVCLSLRHQADPEAYLAQLSTGTPSVQQYLLEEVLKQLPADFQTCLLRTSILNRFCAPLCLSLCEEIQSLSGEESFLRQLESANLFTIRLDAQGQWLRYHHLFQQLLQRRLRLEMSEEAIAALHERAGRWFEKAGLLDEALQHTLHAGNIEGAVLLIEKNRERLLNTDRWYVLEKWIALLPVESRLESPGLLLADAWSAYERFQFDRLSDILARIKPQLDAENDTGALFGEWSLLQGEVHYWSGDGKMAL